MCQPVVCVFVFLALVYADTGLLTRWKVDEQQTRFKVEKAIQKNIQRNDGDFRLSSTVIL
jgi:hypothetical protein